MSVLETDINEEVKQIIIEYNQYVVEKKTNDIDLMFNILERLTTLSYFISELVINNKINYNYSFFERKIELNRAKQRILQEKKTSVNKAEIEANIEVEELYYKEIQQEAIAYKYETLLSQINVIISVLKTKISYLISEKKNVKDER